MSVQSCQVQSKVTISGEFHYVNDFVTTDFLSSHQYQPAVSEHVFYDKI